MPIDFGSGVTPLPASSAAPGPGSYRGPAVDPMVANFHPSLRGFGANLAGNVGDLVNGLGALLGASAWATFHPIQTGKWIASGDALELVKRMGKGLAANYAEYRHPVIKAYNDPLGVVMDALTLASAGSAGFAKGAGLAGKAAKIAEAAGDVGETALQTAKAARLGGIAEAIKPETIAMKTLVPERIGGQAEQFYGGLAQKLGSKVGGRAGDALSSAGEALSTMGKNAAEVRAAHKLTGGATAEAYRLRDFAEGQYADFAEAAKKLTPEENQTWIRSLQGFEQVPADARPELVDAIGKYKAWETSQRAWAKEAGILTPETAEKIGYQPMAQALGWDRAKFDAANLNQVKAAVATHFGDYQPELVTPAVRASRATLPGAEESARQLQLVENSLDRLFGQGNRPTYVMQVHAQKMKPFDFLVKGVRQIKLKARAGAEGYSTNPLEIAWAYNNRNTMLRATQKVMDYLLPKAKPWNPKEPLLPGHMPFTPGGLMGFQRLQKSFLGKIYAAMDEGENLETAVDGAMQTVLHNPEDIALARETLQAGGQEMGLQIPTHIGQTVGSYFRAPGNIEQALKLFYDRPLGYWKNMMLAWMPRWVTNNTVTNALFASVFGVSPRNLWRSARVAAEEIPNIFRKEARPLSAGAREIVNAVPGRISTTGFMATESHGPEHLGRLAGETGMGGFIYSLEKNKVVQAINAATTRMYRVNESLESVFRRAAYLSAGEREVLKKSAGEMLSSEELMKRVSDLKNHPDVAQRLIDSVEQVFGNYSIMSPLERSIVRRVFPFWAWERHILRLSSTLPITNPVRVNLLGKMSELAAMELQDRQAAAGGKLPKWMEGSIPIGTDSAGQTKFLNTSAFNPLSTVDPRQGALGIEAGMISPLAQAPLEMMTGRQTFTQRPFTSPDVVEIRGKFYSQDPNTGQVREMEGPPRPVVGGLFGEPGIGALAYIQSKIPQAQILDQAIHPYSQYSSGTIFQPAPIMENGRPAIPKARMDALLRFLGASISRRKPEGGQKGKASEGQAAKEFQKRSRRISL